MLYSTFSERLKYCIENKGVTPYRIYKESGIDQGTLSKLLNGVVKNPQVSTLDKISEYLNISSSWLLTGEGEMLKSTTSKYNVSEKKGVPYFDVDFIGGFGLIENDQTKNPAYYIEFAAYERAEYWVNITGRSMEPLINHGDIIALKKIDDWQTYILYGEIYAIVTDEYRTVKKVRKSSKGDDFVSLVPVNPEYDVQDIPKSIIKGVFQVLGCAKKIF